MDFTLTARQQLGRDRVRAFIDAEIRPRQETYLAQRADDPRWKVLPVIEEMKAKARAAGIWNLFMPPASGFEPVDSSFVFEGEQLTNLEYALCAEEMGRVEWASEVFNCSAPDTGNMEVLLRYGTKAQKDEWLAPLMRGEIRSAFLMTEPDVASSDATNIQTEIRLDGNHYVLNGRKWWSSGGGDPRCRLGIVMGKSNPDNPAHTQQSMILVPMNTPGVRIERMLQVYGYDHAPHGHAEVFLDNVRVPTGNLLLGEGRGFEIAQGRLGPGRNPSLHAHHRRRRRSDRCDGAAPSDPHRVRQAHLRAQRLGGTACSRTHRYRDVQAPVPSGGRPDGQAGQQSRAHRNLDDQGPGAGHGAQDP